MNIIQKLFKPKVEEKGITIIGEDIGSILKGSGNSNGWDSKIQDNKLINTGYVYNTDVYSVIKKLCDVSKDIPFVVEYFDGEEWVKDEDSSLNKLLSNPNTDINGTDFRFRSMLYLLNTGDIFWRTTTSRFNLITELNLLESNLVELNINSKNELTSYCYDNLNNTETKIPTDEVIHTMYYNPSKWGIESKRGLSPLQAAHNSLKASNNRQTAQSHLMDNRGATNIISSGSDLSVGSKERANLQKNTDKILGGAKNFNKSIVTTANVRVSPLGMSPTDLKIIELKDLDLRDICNAFGVPSTLFNDQAASTLDNLKVGTKLLYNNAVIPNNEMLLSKINESIVPAYSKYENKELRVVQDLSGVSELQEDQLTKSQKIQTDVATIESIASSTSLSDDQKQALYKELGYEL